MNKLSKKLYKFLSKLVLHIMSILIIFTFGKVVLRYLFNLGFAWSEELLRFMFVWLMFIGISLGVYNKAHMGLSSIIKKIIKHSKLIDIIVNFFIITFFVILTYVGFKFSLSGANLTAAVLPIKMIYVYAAIPITSIISVLFSLSSILNDEDKEEK